MLDEETRSFLGSKAFGLAMFRQMRMAVTSVNWRIIHPNDQNDARSVLEDFRALAAVHGIPFEVADSRKKASDLLSSEMYDLGFVCGWYWLLDSSQVGDAAPPLYGIHHSALPQFRGGAPVVWALLAGEQSVGSTLFRLTPGMDDGPIVAQVSCVAPPEINVAHVLATLEDKWSETIGTIWRNLVEGTVAMTPQDEANATYCSQRRPEDGRINWHQPADCVHNFIRAQAFPYPGAFTTTVNGMRVTIDRSIPFDSLYHAVPGQVLQRTSDSVLVGCGHATALYVTEVREEGGLSLLNGRFLT